VTQSRTIPGELWAESASSVVDELLAGLPTDHAEVTARLTDADGNLQEPGHATHVTVTVEAL
jgi:hypothetical protein